MTCTACGADLDTRARFCSHCGRALAVSSSTALRAPTRLIRPREGRMIAGVCAGFALQYGWDVVIVRLIVLLSVLFAGLPLLAYVIAWVVMPNEQYALPAQAASPSVTQTGGGPDSIAM